MKNIIKSILAVALISGFTSCTDEQDLKFSQPEGSFAILSPQSGESVVLSPTTLTNPGLSLTWKAMNYGTPTEVTYKVQVDKTGDNFDTPIDLTSTTNTFASVTSEELNAKCLQAGLTPFTQGGLDVRIRSTVGTTEVQEAFSDVIVYLVKPYSTDLPKVYVVGNFLNASGYGSNWTPANAVPLAASAFGASDYEGFVNMNEASFEYKFLPTNTSFDGDYGDDGSFSGTLTQTGESNCTGTGAGYYYVKANTTSLTYSVQPAQWAITGSATPLGWPDNGVQDQNMTYNSSTKKWEITLQMSTGGNQFKFRANDGWNLNLGKDGGDTDSSMDFGGDNLDVPAPGLYKIELNLSNPRNYSWTATLQ